MNRFCPKKSVITIDELLKYKINLGAKYQRDIVWTLDDKRLFIDSLISGMDVGYLVFNNKTDELVNVDGKQRITSINEFINNELYVHVDDYVIFFDKLPKEYIGNEIARTMTTKEKNQFLKIELYCTIYKDIKYEDETEIFKRLQEGIKLSSGEKLAACFNDEEVSAYFTQWCENKKDIFYGLTNIDTKRRIHNNFIAELIYLCDNEICTVKKKHVMDNITDIESIDELKQKICKIEPTINFLFGKHIFKHKDMRKDSYQVALLGLSYYVCTKLDVEKDIHLIDYGYIRKCITKILKKCRTIQTNKSVDNIQKVYDHCVKYLPSIKRTIINNDVDLLLL